MYKRQAQALTVLQAGIDKAKREGHSGVMPKRSYWGAWAAAAAVLVFIAVPNVSPTAAMAMADMPVLNKVVQVVTFNLSLIHIFAAGAVLQYLYETQKSTLDHLTTIVPYATGNYMEMCIRDSDRPVRLHDAGTVRN